MSCSLSLTPTYPVPSTLSLSLLFVSSVSVLLFFRCSSDPYPFVHSLPPSPSLHPSLLPSSLPLHPLHSLPPSLPPSLPLHPLHFTLHCLPPPFYPLSLSLRKVMRRVREFLWVTWPLPGSQTVLSACVNSAVCSSQSLEGGITAGPVDR